MKFMYLNCAFEPNLQCMILVVKTTYVIARESPEKYF